MYYIIKFGLQKQTAKLFGPFLTSKGRNAVMDELIALSNAEHKKKEFVHILLDSHVLQDIGLNITVFETDAAPKCQCCGAAIIDSRRGDRKYCTTGCRSKSYRLRLEEKAK